MKFGQVDEALVNLLMQPVALAAENAVPVLHAQCGAGEFVVFGDGQIENLVGFEKWDEHGPAFQAPHHPYRLRETCQDREG